MFWVLLRALHSFFHIYKLNEIRRFLIFLRRGEKCELEYEGLRQPSFQYFGSHSSRHDVAGCEILSHRCVLLHEEFSQGIDESAALSPAAFGYEYAAAVNA